MKLIFQTMMNSFFMSLYRTSDVYSRPPRCRLGKTELHELRGVQIYLRFSAKLEDFSAQFGFLDVKVRNNFQNVIFIACK